MPTRRIKSSKKSKAAIAVAKVLRLRRHSLGLSQETFAEKVGLSKNYIGNLERGEYEPSLTVISGIAQRLEVKASDLIREAGF